MIDIILTVCIYKKILLSTLSYKCTFYSPEMLEFCKKRLFQNGCPTTSVMSLAKEELKVAGEVMAMSIIQGGPAPNFLDPEVYRIVSRSFSIEHCKDDFLKETCEKVSSFSSKNTNIHET